MQDGDGVMRGYKVLTYKRRSCITVLKRGGLYYPRSVAVRPKRNAGPLCVFKRKKDAKQFARDYIWPRHAAFIVKCKYEPSSEMAIWNPGPPYRSFFQSLFELPPGTALATTVTCLE